MTEIFTEFALPVMIVVVLPVMIVWLVTRVRLNRENKQSEIILESLKNNPSADPEKLAKMLTTPTLTPEERRNRSLLRGCIWSLIGVAVLASDIYAIAAKSLEDTEDAIMFLLAGGIALAVGLGYLITYYVTSRKAAK